MAEPLRVGLAGLGTVGSSVAAMILRTRDAIAERAGRAVDLVAYASKDPPRDATLDLSKARKVDDPVELARDPGIDVFVELIGGAGRSRQRRQRARSSRQARRHRQQGAAGGHGVELARLAEEQASRSISRRRSAGGIPIIKTLREALAGNRSTASTASSTAPATTS